jgi:hypothetical protein
MIRKFDSDSTNQRDFENFFDAEKYFNRLCQRRTKYPATAILISDGRVKRYYRLDKDWPGDRWITREEILAYVE